MCAVITIKAIKSERGISIRTKIITNEPHDDVGRKAQRKKRGSVSTPRLTITHDKG